VLDCGSGNRRKSYATILRPGISGHEVLQLLACVNNDIDAVEGWFLLPLALIDIQAQPPKNLVLDFALTARQNFSAIVGRPQLIAIHGACRARMGRMCPTAAST